MYSKTEVCFTLILAAGVSWYLNSQHAAAQVGIQGGGLSIADGGHPSPPRTRPRRTWRAQSYCRLMAGIRLHHCGSQVSGRWAS